MKLTMGKASVEKSFKLLTGFLITILSYAIFSMTSKNDLTQIKRKHFYVYAVILIIFTINTFNISICLQKCCFVRSESCFYADIGRLPNLFIQPVNFCACHTIAFSQRISNTITSN